MAVNEPSPRAKPKDKVCLRLMFVLVYFNEGWRLATL